MIFQFLRWHDPSAILLAYLCESYLDHPSIRVQKLGFGENLTFYAAINETPKRTPLDDSASFEPSGARILRRSDLHDRRVPQSTYK